jgi:hypothetical protein
MAGCSQRTAACLHCYPRDLPVRRGHLFSVQHASTGLGPPPADRRALGPAPAARPARSAAPAMSTAGQRAPAGARLEQVEKVLTRSRRDGSGRLCDDPFEVRRVPAHDRQDHDAGNLVRVLALDAAHHGAADEFVDPDEWFRPRRSCTTSRYPHNASPQRTRTCLCTWWAVRGMCRSSTPVSRSTLTTPGSSTHRTSPRGGTACTRWWRCPVWTRRRRGCDRRPVDT